MQHLADRFFFATAPQHRFHTRHQFTRAERFGQIVIRARLQPDHFFVTVHPGGQQDDGGIMVRPIDAHKFIPIHLGHHDIEDDQVGFLAFRDRQGFPSIGGGHHPEPALGQVGFHKRNQAGFVIHYQDSLGSYHFVPVLGK